MRKFILLGVLGLLAQLAPSSNAHAYYYYRPHHYHNPSYYYYPGSYYYPRYYYPSYSYYYPWYNTSCYYGGYGCQNYLESTDSNFRSEISEGQNAQREQAYLQAVNEAANFLQNGGEPTPTLREAIKNEREIALRSGLEEARNFDDQTFAQIILSRMDRMSNPEGNREQNR